MDRSLPIAPSYHQPPAVQFPVRRNARVGVGLAAVAVASGCGLLGWGLSGSPAGSLPGVLGGVVWLITASLAAQAWRRSAIGRLEWDGAGWWFLPEGEALPLAAEAEPEVHLDLQRFLLLSLRLHGRRPVWLCLEQRSSPFHWPALRRAVHSRAGAARGRQQARPASDS